MVSRTYITTDDIQNANFRYFHGSKKKKSKQKLLWWDFIMFITSLFGLLHCSTKTRKEGTILILKDENGNVRPIDTEFTREEIDIALEQLLKS